MRAGLCSALVILMLLCYAPLAGQSVRGRVVDAATGQGVSGVRIELLTADGSRASEAVSGADGAFQVAARTGGEYRLRSSHIAYRASTSQAFSLQELEQVIVDVRLSTAPIPLDPLTITARRHDARRDATHEGFYARQLTLPPLGNSRVITRWDAEMINARDARDVLQWLPRPRDGCLIVWWNGSPVMFPELATSWLETQSSHLEGVEFYRSIFDAPPTMRDIPPYLIGCTLHSVIALWSRTGYFPEPPPEPFRPPRRRINVAAAMYHLSGSDAPGAGAGLEAAVHWPVLYGVAIGLHVRRTAHQLTAETTHEMMTRLGSGSTYQLPQGERPLTLWVVGIEPRVIMGEVAGLWPIASLRVQVARRRLTLVSSASTHHAVPVPSYGGGIGATLGVEKLIKERFALLVAIGHDRHFFNPYDKLERRWNPTSANWGGTSFRVGFGYALER